MIEISKFRQEAKNALLSRGLREDDIVVFAETDMVTDLNYATVYLVLTEDRLCVIEGQTEIGGKPGKLNRRDAVHRTFSETGYREYDFTVPEKIPEGECGTGAEESDRSGDEADGKTDRGIEELSVEELISCGYLCAKIHGTPERIAAMSRTAMRDVRLFVKYAGKYLDDRSVETDEEDFKDDRFCPKCGNRYPDPDRKICPRCMEKTKIYKRLMQFSKKYRFQMLAVLLSLAALSALGVIAPYVSTSFFYDKVLAPGSKWYAHIAFAIVMIIGLRFISALVSALSGVISARVSGHVTYDLKRTIFSAIQRLSLSFFTARQTGGLMNQINNDANTIYWFFCSGVPEFLKNAVQLIAVFVILFVMNPLLAAATAVIMPLFAYSVWRVYRRMTTLHQRRYVSSRSMNSALSDALSGFRVVKSFAREKEETERFDKRSRRLAGDSRTVTIFNNTALPLTSFIMYLSNVVVWALGGWMVISGFGGMTYGKLMAFIAYVTLMNEPMFMFVDMIYWFSDCTNAAGRLFEIADAEPDVREREDPVILGEMKGHVEFRNVEFSYDKSKKVIDGDSFDVEPGQTLGLVGHSGAGKSTLANLLMRLYDVTGGEILIDGVNIKDLSFAELRRNVGIVSQETYLFVGTIMDNIRYARPEATFEEVLTAAKISGAHDFIVKLQDGYDTKIGFGYKDLSGGERQRLSIARAVLLNPKILILDEATAAMDTQTERRIQEALTELSKGRTTIMIAHRLSTLRDAEKLVVIEEGKVQETGTHSELLRHKGIYSKLYTLQLEALRNIGVEE
ncbi:MAG: ABC transporter ATP-binding protein [Clostridia bacterium]|nr:ABC transporter ATP-binding protein [Clostridia bacterium]